MDIVNFLGSIAAQIASAQGTIPESDTDSQAALASAYQSVSSVQAKYRDLAANPAPADPNQP